MSKNHSAVPIEVFMNGIREPSCATRAPKVSVLLPTYNYARYLTEAIDSVLQQKFQDYEIVIVDDCSQDESQTVIRQLASKDNRIRFEFNNPNLGMVANWNYCLSLARGDYIKFLFGDDKLASQDALGKMAQMLDDNPSAILAASARTIIDSNSNMIGLANDLRHSGVHAGKEIIWTCLEKNQNLVGEPSVVMMRRREMSREFQIDYRQLVDLELWFHLLEQGDLVYTTEPLCSFRNHSVQQTELNKLSNIPDEHLMLLLKYWAKPWFNSYRGRKLLFYRIHFMKRKGVLNDASIQLATRMKESMGAWWYAWFLTLHHLKRPFANLKGAF